MAFKDTNSRVEKLLTAAEASFRREFDTMVRAARFKLTVPVLEQLIATGRFALAFDTLEEVIENFSRTWGKRFNIAMAKTATLVRKNTPGNFQAQQASESALRKVREAQARIVREFLRQQRLVSRQSLVDSMGFGFDTRTQAVRFRDAIGLTRKDAAAVESYRRALETNPALTLERKLRDRRFDRSVRLGRLPASRIDRMVDRYRERLLAARAAVIGRTEARRAVREGVEESFQQAEQAGAIQPNTRRKMWITARDEKVRGSHSPMDGQVREGNDPFISGDGVALRYPGDGNAPPGEVINCRCHLLDIVGATAPTPQISQ